MPRESPISLNAHELRSCSREQALAFADSVLGPSQAWGPSLIEYRLQSEFQEDWKTEVGCWLLAAERHGFLVALRKRLERASKESARPTISGPNDTAHRTLQSELAAAMVVYYLGRTGWHFVEWEPRVEQGDVDIRMRSPDGVLADIQVKAPDRPGFVVGGRRVDGERDQDVLSAIDKGIKQLFASPGPQRILVVSPQRNWPMSADTLSAHTIGRSRCDGDEVVLRADDRGVFATHAQNVGAVVDLMLLRGVDTARYRCTVLLNPWAPAGATPSPRAFSGARVLELTGDRFVWSPEAPEGGLHDGTRYLRDEHDGA